MKNVEEIRVGYETAYINGSVVSNPAYRPQFVSNNHKEGKKVLSSIEDELLACDGFQISVAFITMSGITPLLQTLKELEKKNIPGQILTTNYLNFSEPRALEKLHSLSNITLKMYDVEAADEGFHTKGYIFKKEEVYRIIIGSSNITSAALTSNREWNTKLVSTEQGEMAQEIVAEFHELWQSKYALGFDEFYELYEERYRIIKHQREVAKQEEVTSLEKYKLQPNSMQVGFINNLKKIIDAGEERALLISATGTGKTYASAFAMRELGFKRVLFLVHRGQLARQTKKSYERVFAKTKTMGLVGAGYHDYDADYVFATVQTLNRDEHLLKYNPDEFDCIVLDEAHHVPANTYQKIMKHFTPKLWLGMTATPDKRDDNIEGRNVYELFNYQIAYEIRLQQAMEEKLLCPFHYFGISDFVLSSVSEEKNIEFNMLTSDERVNDKAGQMLRVATFAERLLHAEFYKQVMDIIEVGLRRYADIYGKEKCEDTPFVLYQKYSRRDVSYLTDCGKDFSSVMYGKWDYKDDVFLFVTYHKQANTNEEVFVDGKPDYADEFDDSVTFRWDSQMGNGVGGTYVNSVCNAAHKHLLVKKSDSETDFYYMGQFDITDLQPGKKKDKNGKEKDIAKFTFKMHNPVREDLLRYLRSSIEVKEEAV